MSVYGVVVLPPVVWWNVIETKQFSSLNSRLRPPQLMLLFYEKHPTMSSDDRCYMTNVMTACFCGQALISRIGA